MGLQSAEGPVKTSTENLQFFLLLPVGGDFSSDRKKCDCIEIYEKVTLLLA